MAKLKWERHAQEDLATLIEYVARDNLPAAKALLNEIEAKVGKLVTHPRLYKVGRCQGTRELVVRKNYIVVYLVEDDEQIAIVRVLHAAQQWPDGDE